MSLHYEPEFIWKTVNVRGVKKKIKVPNPKYIPPTKVTQIKKTRVR